MTYETIELSVHHHVLHIELNRPDKANAMNLTMWKDIKHAATWADHADEIRVVILSGRGKHFSSGIDLSLFADLRQHIQNDCEGRLRENLRRFILDCQSAFTAIETCRKPVIAAVHGACIGAGLDLIAACDLRYVTTDSKMSIKEIDIGMVADVGTLQRLPKLISDGMIRELAYTGRSVLGTEAVKIGLANAHFDTPDDLIAHVHQLAAAIAAKSPLAIRGTKEAILYARDHSVADSLNQIATWNAGMLLSTDIEEAAKAAMEKRAPVFKN